MQQAVDMLTNRGPTTAPRPRRWTREDWDAFASRFVAIPPKGGGDGPRG